MDSPHGDMPGFDAMTLSVGGRAHQEFAYDGHPPPWNALKTTVFEVHVVSHKGYAAVTEHPAPALFALGPKTKRMEFEDKSFCAFCARCVCVEALSVQNDRL
jgi:hypothetical protein